MTMQASRRGNWEEVEFGPQRPKEGSTVRFSWASFICRAFAGVIALILGGVGWGPCLHFDRGDRKLSRMGDLPEFTEQGCGGAACVPKSF